MLPPKLVLGLLRAPFGDPRPQLLVAEAQGGAKRR